MYQLKERMKRREKRGDEINKLEKKLFHVKG